MQKLLLPLALLLTTLSACSQNSQLDKFYDKYHASDEGAGAFGSSFGVNATFSSSDKKGWLNKVTQFRMLILDTKKTPSLRGEWNELAQSLKKDNYDDLVSIRKGEDNVRLLSKEGKDNLKEFVFFANGKDGGCVFMHIRGHFTAHDMEEIQASLQDSHGKGFQIN